jgi:hypothetical protein
LETQYNDSPCYLTNQTTEFDSLETAMYSITTKSIKTQLTFDDDNSTDSGFLTSSESTTTPFKQIVSAFKDIKST